MFNPKGFLVAILEDDDHAEPSRVALQAAGFADRDLRVYTSQQILADHPVLHLRHRGQDRQKISTSADQTAHTGGPGEVLPSCSLATVR